MMTTRELAALVAEMRSAQREYFRLRSPATLEKCKALERRVDAEVRTALVQPGLFEHDDDGGGGF